MKGILKTPRGVFALSIVLAVFYFGVRRCCVILNSVHNDVAVNAD
jgi:hypothetical protein